MSKKYFIIGLITGFILPILIFIIIAIIHFHTQDIIVAENNDPVIVNLDDLNLVNMSNDTIHISEFNNQAILVNFWGTFCSPCIAEFPYLQKLQKDNNIKVITISDQKIKNIKRFKKENPYNFLYLKSIKPLSTYKIMSIPYSVLLYKKNNIIHEVYDIDPHKVNDIINK